MFPGQPFLLAASAWNTNGQKWEKEENRGINEITAWCPLLSCQKTYPGTLRNSRGWNGNLDDLRDVSGLLLKKVQEYLIEHFWKHVKVAKRDFYTISIASASSHLAKLFRVVWSFTVFGNFSLCCLLIRFWVLLHWWCAFWTCVPLEWKASSGKIHGPLKDINLSLVMRVYTEGLKKPVVVLLLEKSSLDPFNRLSSIIYLYLWSSDSLPCWHRNLWSCLEVAILSSPGPGIESGAREEGCPIGAPLICEVPQRTIFSVMLFNIYMRLLAHLV